MENSTLQNLDNLMRYFDKVIGCLDRFTASETVSLRDAAESAITSITEIVYILDAMKVLTVADLTTDKVPVKDKDKTGLKLVVNNGPIKTNFKRPPKNNSSLW